MSIAAVAAEVVLTYISEGVPFDIDDSMINPPTNLRHSQNDMPELAVQHPVSITQVPTFPPNVVNSALLCLEYWLTELLLRSLPRNEVRRRTELYH